MVSHYYLFEIISDKFNFMNFNFIMFLFQFCSTYFIKLLFI